MIKTMVLLLIKRLEEVGHYYKEFGYLSQIKELLTNYLNLCTIRVFFGEGMNVFSLVFSDGLPDDFVQDQRDAAQQGGIRPV